MKKIISTRGSGKTTSLIYESARTGAPIICFSEKSACYIEQLALRNKLIIPKPISIKEFAINGYVCDGKNKFLIDELDACINQLFKGNLIGYSLTIEEK